MADRHCLRVHSAAGYPFFLEPTVTREAARRYGLELSYASRPSWLLYRGLLSFVRKVRTYIADLGPRDMIDMQSFLWVQGSEEYLWVQGSEEYPD
jgi:hypothetical protein